MKTMNVLFFPVYIVTPHFETDLELMRKHLDQGDNVFVAYCEENLFSCLFNPGHLKSFCYRCRNKFDLGMSLIDSRQIRLIPLQNINLDYSVIPKQFNSSDDLKKFKIGGINIGLCVDSTLVSRHDQETDLDTSLYAKEIETECKTALYVYGNFKRIAEEINPDLVHLFNGRFSTALPALEYCEQKGIQFFTHELAGSPQRYSLTKNTFPHDTSYVGREIEELWKKGLDDKEKIGSSFFVERRNRVTQGWYSYATEQMKDSLPVKLPVNKKIVTIYNSTIGEYASIRGWEKPIHLFSDENDCFNRLFEYFRDSDQIQFYLRIHPHLKMYENTQARYLRSYIGKYKNVEVISPESIVDTYALLDNSDLVITLGSTVGVEASYWGKPVISLAKSYYEELACCYTPKSIIELVQMIMGKLSPANPLEAIKYGYWEKMRGNEYEYYTPSTPLKGKFLGKEIELDFIQLIVYKTIRAFEIGPRRLPSVIQKKLLSFVRKITKSKSTQNPNFEPMA